jgi:GNAT superfamily N-acetyltransferase
MTPEDPGSVPVKEAGEDEMPIAWAFLGVDGAVATLHVEPEHRGRGLALSLSKEVMRRGMAAEGVFGAKKLGIVDEETRAFVEDWVHAEVAGYNKASNRVMEKIGGTILTTVLWTVIELLD